MSTSDFIERKFNSAKESHNGLIRMTYDEANTKLADIDDPAHNWEYFGSSKFGRYAVSEPLGINRGLSMGEFYGAGTVD